MMRKAGYFVAREEGLARRRRSSSRSSRSFRRFPAGSSAYGDYFASQRQYDKATAQWQAALALDPNSAGALLGLGEISMQSGKLNDSISYLKHYTQISPDAQGYALLRPSVFAPARLFGRARCLRQELRNPALAGDARLRSRSRLRAEELQRGGANLRRARSRGEGLPRSEPTAALHGREVVCGSQQMHQGGGCLQAASADDEKGHEGLRDRAARPPRMPARQSTPAEVRNRLALRRSPPGRRPPGASRTCRSGRCASAAERGAYRKFAC